MGEFSDLCVSELVSRTGSLRSLPGLAFVTLALRWMRLLWYIRDIWEMTLDLCHWWVFVRVLSAFYRADQALLWRLWRLDTWNCLHPSPHLNPGHPEKHPHYPGLGGEQLPGVRPSDRHSLIIIAGFVVVQVFFLEWVKLGLMQRLALSRWHKSWIVMHVFG